MSRNRISNISLAVSSAGGVIILAIMVGILKALKPDQSTENNTRAFSVLMAFLGGVCCKCNHLSVPESLVDDHSYSVIYYPVVLS